MKKFLLATAMLFMGMTMVHAQCTPGVINCNLDDRLDRVIFAGIDNSAANTGCSTNGYGDYSALTANPVFGANPFSALVGPGGYRVCRCVDRF